MDWCCHDWWKNVRIVCAFQFSSPLIGPQALLFRVTCGGILFYLMSIVVQWNTQIVSWRINCTLYLKFKRNAMWTYECKFLWVGRGCLLLDVNLGDLYGDIFIGTTFISAHPLLNVVSGWLWQLLVEPWRAAESAACTLTSTTSPIPQSISKESGRKRIVATTASITEGIIPHKCRRITDTGTVSIYAGLIKGSYKCPKCAALGVVHELS